MSERQPQPRQHDKLKRVGRLGTLGLTATLLAGGASAIPMDVKVDISSRDAESATLPYHWVNLASSDSSQTIKNVKKGIIFGDISIAKKGIFPDSKTSTKEMIIIDFGSTYNLTGVVAKHGGSVLEMYSWATNSQFNNLVGSYERSQLPGGKGYMYEETHRITSPYAESYPILPSPSTCKAIADEFNLPITTGTETTGIANVKRAVITGDISGNGFGPDSDTLTGESVIINFSSAANLTGVKNQWGAHARIIADCATTDQANAVIGAAVESQTLAHGGQMFKITTP